MCSRRLPFGQALASPPATKYKISPSGYTLPMPKPAETCFSEHHPSLCTWTGKP